MPDPIPLHQPIPTRPTPEVLDTLFYEIVDPTNATEYRRLPVGSEHENTLEYPGFKLVNEESLSYTRSKRWYSNGHTNQDSYNYSINYSGDANAYEIFSRRYLYRRDQYSVATKAVAFTGVYLIKVTEGGSGYEEAPTVTLSGGAGTGATARAVVNKSGSVTWVLLVTEGTGFTSAPTVAFSGGGGSGATAIAVIQPTTCYLVKEQVTELAEDDPRKSLFVAVVRVYEVLPGPYIPFTRYDLLLGPIQGRRRAVLASAQVPALTATTKTTYEGRDGSAIVSWEIEETNTTGAGSGANPVFPTLVEDDYDNEHGPIQRTTQLVNATGSEVGSSSVAGGVVTEIRYEPFNQFLLKKITTTWAVPVTRTDKETVTVHGGGVATKIRIKSGTQSTPVGGLMVIEDKSVDLGGGVFENTIETVSGAAWTPLLGTHVDEATGITINFTKQVVGAGIQGGVVGDVYTEIQTLDKWLSISIASVLDPDSLPADRVLPITVRHTFPDTLTFAQFVIVSSNDGNAKDFALNRVIKEGYSGPCNGTLTEKYMTAADYEAWSPPAITQFFPVSVVITGAYWTDTTARILTFSIPPTLHAAIDPSNGSIDGTSIAATSPAALPTNGSFILTDIQTEKWRFGVYKVSMVHVKVVSQT